MIESAFPILEVADMGAALAFYRDAFGGVLTYTFPSDGEPVYVSLSVGASSLGIGLAEAPPPPGNVLLWFYVDDVDGSRPSWPAPGHPWSRSRSTSHGASGAPRDRPLRDPHPPGGGDLAAARGGVARRRDRSRWPWVLGRGGAPTSSVKRRGLLEEYRASLFAQRFGPRLSDRW